MRPPLARLLSLLALACAMAGCESGSQPAPPIPAAKPAEFAGDYTHGDRHLYIARRDGGYWLKIESPGSCAFEGAAMLIGEQLQVSLQDWKPGALLTVRHAAHGSVDVLSEQEDDRFNLGYFCHAGETLSGNYARGTAPAIKPAH